MSRHKKVFQYQNFFYFTLLNFQILAKFWLNTCLLGCREHNLTLYLVQGMFYTTKDTINNSIDTYKVPDHMPFMLCPSMYNAAPISKYVFLMTSNALEKVY